MNGLHKQKSMQHFFYEYKIHIWIGQLWLQNECNIFMYSNNIRFVIQRGRKKNEFNEKRK